MNKARQFRESSGWIDTAWIWTNEGVWIDVVVVFWVFKKKKVSQTYPKLFIKFLMSWGIEKCVLDFSSLFFFFFHAKALHHVLKYRWREFWNITWIKISQLLNSLKSIFSFLAKSRGHWEFFSVTRSSFCILNKSLICGSSTEPY